MNVAWQSGQRFVDLFGALWLADYVGAFLTAGGAGTYFFHYLPLPLGHACDNTFGTFSLHVADDAFQIKQPLAQFHASDLLTHAWTQPGDGVHQVFPARADVTDAAGHTLVTAYALHRPDQNWSLLLINKDASAAHAVTITFKDDTNPRPRSFTGPVTVTTFGPAQYQWHPGARDGHAAPDDPPATTTVTTNRFTLPAASLTVLRAPVR